MEVAGRAVLDTSFLIDYWRGLPEAVAAMRQLVEDGVDLVVNDVIVCELMTGLRAEDLEAGRALLRPLEFVQPGPESAVSAGRWRAESQSRGWTLSLADALIAAAADASGAAVVTRNERDFARLPVRVARY